MLLENFSCPLNKKGPCCRGILILNMNIFKNILLARTVSPDSFTIKMPVMGFSVTLFSARPCDYSWSRGGWIAGCYQEG
jgi:hypothetical protein